MLDRLAIIIIGMPNSGKTTTLKHFSATYYPPKVSTFKRGWRIGMVPFLPKYYGVKINAYILPSSPTESNIPLEEIIEPLEWYPEFLFMAEQYKGAQYKASIKYLRYKEYKIKEFIIDSSNTDGVWHLYNKIDESLIQLHRTEQIGDCVREFINSRT